MFATVLEQAEEETVSRLVPVILERVGLLYPVQHYRGEIHEYVIAVIKLLFRTLELIEVFRIPAVGLKLA